MPGYGQFCPHCGNNSRQKDVFKHRYWEDVETSDGGTTDMDFEYVVRVCGTCDHLLVYHRISDVEESEALAYPGGGLSSLVPRRVRDLYYEAGAVKLRSPNAFAALIRKALEFACKDRGAQGRSLAERIEFLAQRGDLPKAVSDASHLIRHLGNIGVHDDEGVSADEADAMDEFFQVVTGYLYVLPPKLKAFEEKLRATEAQESAPTED